MTMPFAPGDADAISLEVIALAEWDAYAKNLPAHAQHWCQAMCSGDAEPKSGQWLAIPNDNGGIQQVLACLDAKDPEAIWHFGSWSRSLPAAIYRFTCHGFACDTVLACLAWGMGAYRFDHYREDATAKTQAQLCWPDETCATAVGAWLAAITQVRDFINMPANDCHPAWLAGEAVKLAQDHGGSSEVHVGDELLQAFPAVHAVGRASAYPPRLVHLRFEKPGAPKLILVGKGVCFDSGGINLKSSAGLVGMKKDMAGAAHALGLARYLLMQDVPIHLEVILPIVENMVSGNACRTGDVIASRLGVSIEVNNTDAEGRLILADALALACEQKPDAIFDFASLTGAQRVAMGPDIPSYFTNDEAWSERLMAGSKAARDPIWPAPLYAPYKQALKSDIADISNAANMPYGGSITAALFLQRFVEAAIPWVHFDLSGANTRDKAARPKGGEAMGIRACALAIKGWLAKQ